MPSIPISLNSKATKTTPQEMGYSKLRNSKHMHSIQISLNYTPTKTTPQVVDYSKWDTKN